MAHAESQGATTRGVCWEPNLTRCVDSAGQVNARDGAGYPRGLAGDEIPLEARIATFADIYDSLTRDRPYRPALKLAEALEFVRASRGTRFDPDVVDAFLAAQAEIRRARGSHKVPPRFDEIRAGDSPAVRKRPQRTR